MTDHDHTSLPPDLAQTAQAIDQLAKAEARAAPPDLERRLLAATADLIATPEAAPQPVIAVIGRRRFAMAIAAAIGLLATVTVTWIAMRPASIAPDLPGTTAYASDLDLFLSLTADDGDLRGKFDLLLADTAALEADMRSGVDAWSTFDDGGSL
jgi:hypothetical protein